MPSDAKLIAKVEWSLWWTGVALVLCLHGVLLANVGALWRDEISSVLLARSPSWGIMYRNLVMDSFPGLWVTLLRIWHLLGFGAGDNWMRFFGFVLSVLLIASLWINARLAQSPPPILALALVAFNPAVFYWGDSLRAYALAALLVVALHGIVWRACQSATKAPIIAATLVAVLAAQANYQNSYIIFAICVGGAVVCAARRAWLRAGFVMGAGLIAAVSLVPYRSTIRAYSEVGKIIAVPVVDVSVLWNRFSQAFEGAKAILLPAVIVLVLVTLFLPFYFRLLQRRSADTSAHFRARLYAAVVIVVVIPTLICFAKAAGFPTQGWYYIPILATMAVCIELSLASLLPSRAISIARISMSLLIILVSIPPIWRAAHTRRTNMDIAAAQVAQSSTDRDLVLINPFWMCISFGYHYNGHAPWSLLPVVSDEERSSSYLAEMPLMTSAAPLKPTFERIAQTLQNGGRVWFVGGVNLLPQGALPPPWHPAPHPQFGWQNVAFMQIWSAQTGYFIQQHAMRGEILPVKANKPVSRFEDTQVIFVVEGWRSS